MRDDDPSGAGLVPNSDSTRMVNTGTIALGEDYLMGLEALYIRGPFSVQAEYGWNWMDNAIGVINSGTALNPALTPPQNYMFSGGYIQVAYTLTGETRAYDKRIGTLAREYFGHTGPYSKAYIVRDADGNICSSWGAWEIAARLSYVDLNDGSGSTRIQGGEMNGVTLAPELVSEQQLECHVRLCLQRSLRRAHRNQRHAERHEQHHPRLHEWLRG